MNFSFSVVGNNETVDQSQCKSIETGKHNSMLSPIQAQPIPNELSIVFGDENERNDPQIDFANLTVDVDQANKQILVDVSSSMLSLTQNLHEKVHESLNASTCGVITEDTFIKSPEHTPSTRNSINATKSSAEIDDSCYKSTEVAQNDSVKINTTPAMKHFSFERERTPIGVIRLRKVTPKIATPELNISDDEAYEVVVVNKSRHSHMYAEHFDTLDSTMSDIEENSPATNYPMMPINAEIASKSTAKAHPFPFSPRIILHRINSIDEYQESVSKQETPEVTMDKSKRNASKTKATHTKNGTHRTFYFHDKNE